MDIFLISIAVICFCSVNYEVNSQPFLTRKESSTFLETSRVKRSEEGCGESNVCYKCSCHHCPYGKYCQMSSSCNPICVEINECSSNPCRNGGTCHDGRGSYTCSCAPSWTGVHCTDDINECDTSPCQYDGTCKDLWKDHSCTCKAGITGRNCEIDIDECSSNPCQNNATCTDHINYYKCHCTPRIYGVNCDTNICHPTPADVVFVLDSSVSMSESDFRKQLEFVAKFTDNVIIGPRDFQISVITFSFDAHVEFFLNQYADNATLKEAIMNITYKPGATFTDKGLEAVKTVFSPGHGIERRVNGTQADRFVYLLTDGMSNHRQNTIAAAKELKEDCRVTLAAVGIGHMVSHAELVNIASEHDHLLNVYSVNNFNSLYTLLKQLVRYNCDECQLSAKSDVAVVIDTSYNVTIEQYETCIDAVLYLVDLIDLAVDKAHVSVTTFDTAVSDVFGLINNKDKDGIKAEVNRIVPSTEKSKVNIVDVLDSVATNVFSSARADAAKFLIIFSNGYFENVNSLKLQRLKTNFAMQNIEIIAVASGTDVNLEGLMPLVADSFHIFHTKPDKPPTNLDVLQSDFVYSTCDLKNE